MERKRKYNLYISDPTHDVPVRSKHRSKKTVSLDASPLPTLQNGSAQSPDLVSVVASEETLCDHSHPPVNDDSDCSGKSVESPCIKSPDPTDVDSPNTDTSSESSDAETSGDEAHAYITTGIGYRSIPMGPNDVSLTFNTDGVPLFESSKFGFWPLLAQINELTYKDRVQRLVLAGLWPVACGLGPKSL
ncbi:hypothetical protein MRX96_045681 [Rhipicephalus microplus]